MCGGATDGWRPSPQYLAEKPFAELEVDEIRELNSNGSEYLQSVFDQAEALGNDRLIGAVAAFAYTKAGNGDPTIYSILNKAFPGQDWQVW